MRITLLVVEVEETVVQVIQQSLMNQIIMIVFRHIQSLLLTIQLIIQTGLSILYLSPLTVQKTFL